MTAGDLLRIKPQFSIALATLHFASGEHRYQQRQAGGEQKNCRWNVRAAGHLNWNYNIRREIVTASPPKISLKRVYDEPASSDDTRVLVDRLWPRGLTKEHARVDQWLRGLAPSNELRKWFHAHRGKWTEFREKYLQELHGPEATEALATLSNLLSAHHVTLLFAAKNIDQNNAVVLKEVMEGVKKPLHTTGLVGRKRRIRRTR